MINFFLKQFDENSPSNLQRSSNQLSAHPTPLDPILSFHRQPTSTYASLVKRRDARGLAPQGRGRPRQTSVATPTSAELHRVPGSRLTKLVVTEPRQAVSDRWAPLVGIIDTSTSYVDHRPLPAAVEVTSSGAEGGRLAHLCDQVERRAGAASGAHHAVSASQPLRPGTCIEAFEPFILWNFSSAFSRSFFS